MLKSYFKIAWRNLWKNKAFSIINIFGLSVGIAFTLLIGAYVWGELRINDELQNADNQYIILSKWHDANQGADIASVDALPKALKANYPNLVANYYSFNGITSIVSKGEKSFRECMQFGDSTLLKMYGFKLLHGDAATALNGPLSVVITQRMALKYFGKTDVVGQTLNFQNFNGNKHDFAITGVLPQLPKNSVTNLNESNNSDFFFGQSSNSFWNFAVNNWNNAQWVNYIELQKGVDPKAVERAMRELLVKNSIPQVAKDLTPYLVSLKDYNLTADGGVVKKMIVTLSAIALFILLMAVINFVNICIGRSSGRMKEMGVRKVLGGLRKQLIWQFLVESVLMVLFATLFAVIIYLFARPYFSNVLGREIEGLLAFPVYVIPVLLVFVLLVGGLAGIYPALVLSALRSVDAIKGKLTAVKERVFFRKALVAFQFTTAAVVFIGAIIVSKQISLFFGNSLGYSKDYIVYAQLPRDWSAAGVSKMEAIREQMAQLPQVSSVSLSFEIPDGANGVNSPVYRQGSTAVQAVAAQILMDDSHYAETYNIPIKAGTFFKPVYKTADSTLVAINETQSKALGFKQPDDAIGQKIIIQQGNVAIPYTIGGVTADFHFGSLHERIKPVIFVNVNYYTAYRYFSFKLKVGDMQQNLNAVQKKWAELIPNAPFEYHFMDDALTKLYTTELQLKKAAYIAAVLAVIIVLLGVLGLISLSIQKRTREIGIRKVLGSSVAGITGLFLKDFLGVVIIAGLIACPLAYVIMQKWLNDYVYRIDMSLSPFVVSIVVLTAVTAVLIVLQTIRAAFANPVKSLRSE
ncbi:putative ABC transport system permease protein [Mucilaginibacter oryzae]|uniref:Putative ABC transport system permease protein n=1 Tax=Mucilaginibacter oryzae TaxID=468058 RepID=A0A316H699_9SPHI|nr:ABC transporter permease [Mucilaginibacter oryzae]PWK76504.1 putative ABC transport system permease protein [Mucilaginibacter oryzae]